MATTTNHAKSNGHTSVVYEEEGGGMLPPHSAEAEEALLGSLLIDPDRLPEIDMVPQMFFIGFNRALFKAMRKLQEEKRAIDFITLMDKLRGMGVENEERVVGLLNAVPTSVNIHSYAKIVREMYMRRQLIQYAGSIASLSYDSGEDLHDIFTAAFDDIRTIVTESTRGEPVSSYDAAYRMLELVTNRRENKEVRDNVGLSTGFLDLDRLLNGIENNTLLIIGARPGIGKSLLEQEIRTHVAKKGKRVLSFNLEMSIEQMMFRSLSARVGVSYKQLSKDPHTLSDQHWTLFNKAIGEFSEYPIHFVDTAIMLSEIEATAHKLRAEHGRVDLITVDYLQLMGDEKQNNSANRAEIIGQISRGLKNLAKELDTVVIALAQVNRAVEHRPIKRPILADLRDSGTIEQDADIVFFLYRDVVYNPDTTRDHIMEIEVAKHRNGPLGTVDLYFNGDKMLIRNLSRDPIEF